uniref:Helicase C-terminal domain-containing protein n=1 Tax=Acrobeloides nanus TaxID=290746 RepID=A0A914E5P8_9BILA
MLNSTLLFAAKNLFVIRDVPKTIIFVEQKRQSDRIAIMLSLEKIKSMSLNGDRNQQQRQEALNNFVKGDIHVLVATNVAARGLNIRGVKHVYEEQDPLADEEQHPLADEVQADEEDRVDEENVRINNRNLQVVVEIPEEEAGVPANENQVGIIGHIMNLFRFWIG